MSEAYNNCRRCGKTLNIDKYEMCGVVYCNYTCYSDFVKAIILMSFRRSRCETDWAEDF